MTQYDHSMTNQYTTQKTAENFLSSILDERMLMAFATSV